MFLLHIEYMHLFDWLFVILVDMFDIQLNRLLLYNYLVDIIHKSHCHLRIYQLGKVNRNYFLVLIPILDHMRNIVQNLTQNCMYLVDIIHMLQHHLNIYQLNKVYRNYFLVVIPFLDHKLHNKLNQLQ